MAGLLVDQVVLVTGASRGIGRAICLALAGEGATIVLTARSLEKLRQTAALVEKAGGRTLVCPADLTDEQAVKGLVSQTVERFGRLDILINNAGVTHSAALEQTTTQAWEQCLFVNARGPFILCREAIPVLKRASAGFIINIASVVGVKGYPMQSAYTASKHALRGMTLSLAEELRDTGIRVHLLCPGGVDTELVSQVRPDIDKSRLIEPEEIAELVHYLVTHKGNAVIDELHIRRATAAPWF